MAVCAETGNIPVVKTDISSDTVDKKTDIDTGANEIFYRWHLMLIKRAELHGFVCGVRTVEVL